MVLTEVPRHRKAPSTDWSGGELFGAGWFDGARVISVSPNGEARVLSRGFKAACDPDVSFDGRHVVFAGKRSTHSAWGIWETGIEGGECRQVSKDARGCRSPRYLSSLFTLDSNGPWFTVLYVGQEDTLTEQGTGLAASLYSVKLDGTERRRLTFNPKGDADPVELLDGRVIYAGGRNVAPTGTLERNAPPTPESGRCSLFAINLDGTDQELFGGEQGKKIQRLPCATEQGLVVFVETDTPWHEDGGQLGAVEQRRPHHSYRPVPADPRFTYLYPSPLSGNKILVSRRPRQSMANWSVVALDVDSGNAEPVFEDGRFEAVQAKVARPRPMPDGRSSVIDPEYHSGILYALNLYESDAALKPRLAPGSIQRVRVIEGVPAPAQPRRSSSSGPSLGRRLLGEAPVEKDGSMQLLVPADTPLELQALDEEGMALATCRWIWVKQKENRGCIGCHEDHELVPENLYTLAVQRPANNLALPVERRRTVAFREQILPLLQANCAGADCHRRSRSPLSRLRAANVANKAAREVYEALLAPENQEPQAARRDEPKSPPQTSPAEPASVVPGKYVDPGCARTSFLVWMLSGRDKSRPWDQADSPLHFNRQIKRMPPPGKAAPLTEQDFRLLVEWIDLGAAWEARPPPIVAMAKKPAAARPLAAANTGGR
jgi:hypothetical protein